MTTTEETVQEAAEHGHEEHGHDEGFWRTYVFSVDHKVIGIQYAVTGLLFLLFGFTLMMLMRWQIAYPGEPIPLIGQWLGDERAPGGIMLPEFYNQLGAMHGTIMVFLGVVPLAVGGFGNFVLPLQIGAPDMAFPKLNMASYWTFFPGGVIMFASFFVPGGAANSGWTSYAPLSVFATTGQTMWLVGMVFLITSSLLGSVNFIVTTVQLRAPGLSFMRLPFFVWAQLVTAFLLLLAFPPLEAAGVLQLMDRVAGTSFFMPSGLVYADAPWDASGGGSVLLWQHLFWFLAHPEVYVLILPALGIVADIVANNTRKPIWGYRVPGRFGDFSWVHVVYRLGASHVPDRHGNDDEFFLPDHNDDYLDSLRGHLVSTFYLSVRRIDSLHNTNALCPGILTHVWNWRADWSPTRIICTRYTPARHLLRNRALPTTSWPLEHSWALFGGIYYWFPKATGRKMNDMLGKIHFWGSFIAINVVFMPMFIQGLSGMNRRMYDGGAQYVMNQERALPK